MDKELLIEMLQDLGKLIGEKNAAYNSITAWDETKALYNAIENYELRIKELVKEKLGVDLVTK